MTDRIAQWRDILELSRQILHHARESDWEFVSEQEPRRSEMLHRFFAEPVPKAGARAVRQGIEEMLAMNDEIMQLGGSAKQELRASMAALGRNRKAARAYSRAETHY